MTTKARERMARRAGYPEYDALTLDELRSEKRSLGLREAVLGEQLSAIRQRAENLKLRIRAVADGDVGIGISDHAVVRFLQRRKGVDINAVRAEIRELASRAQLVESATDQRAKVDGLTLAVAEGNTIVTVWTDDDPPPEGGEVRPSTTSER